MGSDWHNETRFTTFNMLHSRLLLLAFLLLPILHTTTGPASTLTFIDLNPAGATKSLATGVDASGQAGSAYFNGIQHAAMWSGTPDSFVDLHPSGALRSRALAGGGLYQGGTATFVFPPANTVAALWAGDSSTYQDFDPGLNNFGSAISAVTDTQQGGQFSLVVNGTVSVRPVLWSSSAGIYVDLTPTGIGGGGIVYGIDATQQVGNMGGHAALWSGTPDSFVDLHPAVATYSAAYGVSGSLQVGTAHIAGVDRPALWSGTSNSFTDLTPPGASGGFGHAASGAKQAGSVMINGSTHAALWSGSVASFMDLQAVLGSDYTNSTANAVWTDGQTTYIAGLAYPVSSATTTTHAILWTLVEPPTPPPLQIASTLSGAVNVSTLTWSNNGISSQLESSDALTGTWNSVSTAATTNGNWISVVVSNTADAQFFRLRAN
jgi:hypothetical protein